MKRRTGDDAFFADGTAPASPSGASRRTGDSDRFDADFEEFEQIPWGMLSAELGAGRRITTGAIVLAVLAVVIAAVVGLTVLRSSPDVVAITPEVPLEAAIAPTDTLPGLGNSPPGAGESAPVTVPSGTVLPEEGGTGASDASPAPVTPAPSLYSEADLMAVMPEHELRLASVTAETFVAGVFTDDGVAGDPGFSTAKVAGEPASPSVGTTWVERVGAVAIRPVGPGAYDVTVVVGVMAGDADGVFRRLPLRSVTVPVAVDDDGIARVTDLPTPVATPILAAAIPDPGEATSAPEKVAMGARNLVPWDGPVEVTTTHRTDTGWRVHLTADGSAPLVIHIPDP